MDYAAAALAILGAWLVARKNRNGFLCWIVANALWVVWGWGLTHWSVVGQYVVFWVLAAYGWWNWRVEP